METIPRPLDVINNNNDLEVLGTFSNFPCFMGCVDQPFEQDKFYDMCFHISSSSGCIQLNPILPLELVYQNDHGSGVVGSLWNQHHDAFASFLRKFQVSSVLEIGGGTGILAKKYASHNHWTIIDPNPNLIPNSGATAVKAFFSADLILDCEFDSIVHSHVIEHVYDFNEFLSTVRKFLGLGKRMYFSVPNLQKMFELFHTNVINFEHTVLLSEAHIDYLLAKHKFRIIDKQYFLNSHSIFYAVEQDNTGLASDLDVSLYQHNRQLFWDYVFYYDNLIDKLNKQIANHSGDLYLFGAHIFSQFLINRGLDISKIKYIIDNDVNKQGKRLYGTRLFVKSPKILGNARNPGVILKVSNYREEIMSDILDHINSSTIFYE